MRQYHILDDEEGDNFLCCCEYFNLKHQRSHILGCCFNCEDVNDTVERKLTGRTMPYNIYRAMQDRCRIPWMGGARTVPLDMLLPFMLLPALAFIASINAWCTFAVFLTLPLGAFFFLRFFGQHMPQTKFFLSCTVASGIYLLMIFEYLVVPHLEILVSENCMFLALVVSGSLFLFSAKFSNVCYPNNEPSVCESGSEQLCKACLTRCSLDTMHCSICECCVTRGEYHCPWLDCCIGGKNRSVYMAGLVLIMSALLFYSYLVLTTACHPFLFLDLLLIPDDCSDVFYDYYIALCFVGGTYSLIIAIVLLVIILRHAYLTMLGFTCYEWSQLPSSDKQCCRLESTKSRLRKDHLVV